MDDLRKEYEEFNDEFKAFAKEMGEITGCYFPNYRETQIEFREKLKSRYDNICDDFKPTVDNIINAPYDEQPITYYQFAVDLFYNMRQYWITNNLCRFIAHWIQDNGNHDDINSVIKDLSYLCGTEEKRAIEFLKSVNRDQLSEMSYQCITAVGLEGDRDESKCVAWLFSPESYV